MRQSNVASQYVLEHVEVDGSQIVIVDWPCTVVDKAELVIEPVGAYVINEGIKLQGAQPLLTRHVDGKLHE